MRTPTPCRTVTTVPEKLLLVRAEISQMELAHSELPVTAPATPNCCCCPAEQPRSSASPRLRASFLIGFTVTQVGAGVSVVVYSGLPSPVTSVQVVLAAPQGTGTAFAGSAMNCGVL